MRLSIVFLSLFFVTACAKTNFYSMTGTPTAPSTTSTAPSLATPPDWATPVIAGKWSPCVRNARLQDTASLVNTGAFFGRPVEIIQTMPDNVNVALHVCQTYAAILDPLTGSSDSSISMNTSCTHFEDVMEIQFNLKVHADELQKSGDYVEYCQDSTGNDPVTGQPIPLRWYAGWTLIQNSDMTITVPDDCVTKTGFVNYYAGGGLAGYLTQSRCERFDDGAAHFILRISKP